MIVTREKSALPIAFETRTMQNKLTHIFKLYIEIEDAEDFEDIDIDLEDVKDVEKDIEDVKEVEKYLEDVKEVEKDDKT